MATAIDIRGVSKVYRAGGQTTAALSDLSLRIEPGELFFLLGPSGCGKTTLLRMIAGFLPPTSGEILFDGKDVSHVPPNKRNTGMVFQSYALWPHMTVAANVGFGLRVRRVAGAEYAARIDDALRAVRMGEYAKRRPNQLSGGQQQRVALARALVVRPDVLLLDEPLSNLDARLRVELREEIRTICKQYGGGMTTVYVTHDQKEAMSMADRVALMRHGRVVQVGDPQTLYRAPKSRFAAEFLGSMNYVPCRVLSSGGGASRVECIFGCFDVAGDADAGRETVIGIRPESVMLSPDSATPSIEARVRSVTFLGDSTQVDVQAAGSLNMRAVTPRAPLSIKDGQPVRIGFSPLDATLLDKGEVGESLRPREAVEG